jgi:hypothetical protein
MDKLLSFAEAADALGISEGTLRNGAAGTRELARVRMGRRVLFSQKIIEALIARKVREAEDKKRQQENHLADQLAGKRRQKLAVRRALLRLVNGKKRNGGSND